MTNANATAELPTVYTEYDPKWGNVVDADDVIGVFKNLMTQFSDLLSVYKGTPEEKAKIDDYIAKLREGLNNPNLIPETKTELETKINLISTKWDVLKTCPGSPSSRIAAGPGDPPVCSPQEIKEIVDYIQGIPLTPNSPLLPNLVVVGPVNRCNTDIPTYWVNTDRYLITTPQLYSDNIQANGYNWNIRQFTLYDVNWKTNNKWWWIREVCIGANCENKQLYYYKDGEYLLLYDKAVDCDATTAGSVALADGIGLTFAMIYGSILVGPEELIIETGIGGEIITGLTYVGKFYSTLLKFDI